MTNSGCDIKEIPDMRFQTLNTKHAASLINGLIQSSIKYSAKYNDEKLTLAYSSADETKVQDILKKGNSDTADFIERTRSNTYGDEDITAMNSLLPEIADIMSLSTSALQSRPAELRMLLTHTYIDYWFCDRATIQTELSKVSELGFAAKAELEKSQMQQELSNNTPQTRKTIHEQEQQLDNAAAVEREIFRQQREAIAQENNRTSPFSISKLRYETERIRQLNHQKQQELQQPEREKK